MSNTHVIIRLPRWSLPAILALSLTLGWAGARIDLSALANDSDEALGKTQVERFFPGLPKARRRWSRYWRSPFN